VIRTVSYYQANFNSNCVWSTSAHADNNSTTCRPIQKMRRLGLLCYARYVSIIYIRYTIGASVL